MIPASRGQANNELREENKYSVSVFYTGQKELLERQKKVMWMLERGKKMKVEWEKV